MKSLVPSALVPACASSSSWRARICLAPLGVAARCERGERGRAGKLGSGLVVNGERGAGRGVHPIDDVAAADVDYRIARGYAGVAVVDAHAHRARCFERTLLGLFRRHAIIPD